MKSSVEQFGQAWKADADGLSAGASDGSLDVPAVQRILAAAERGFVLAFPDMEPAIAKRFRSLLLQARKFNPATVAKDAEALASQMRDAWLLIEVGHGVGGGGKSSKPDTKSTKAKPARRGGMDKDFAAAFGMSPEQAAAMPPPSAPPDLGGVVITTPIAQPKPERPRLSARERFHRLRRSPYVHGLLAALFGVGLVWGIAQAVPRRTPPRTVGAGNPSMPSDPATGGPRRVLLPVSGLGRDGPIVSVVVRPRVSEQPADWEDPIAVLDWADQRYAAMVREGFAHDLTEALRSGESPWRDSGTAGALADTVAYGLTLTIYGHRQHLLPSEVLYHRGGDPDALALAFAWVAWRLGLPLAGIAMTSSGTESRPAAIVGDRFPFGPAPRSSPSPEPGALRPVVLRACTELARRVADAGRADLEPLLEVLAKGGATALELGEVRRRHLIGRLRVAGEVRDEQLAADLLALEGGPALLTAGGGAAGVRLLELAVAQLGHGEAPLEWLEALHERAEGHAFADGTPLTEAVALALLEGGEEASGRAMEMLAGLLKSHPARGEGLIAMLLGRGQVEAARALAGLMMESGELPWPAVRLVVAGYMGEGDDLAALALLLGALKVKAKGIPPRPWETAESAVPLDVLRQAQALAVSRGEWEHARWLAAVGMAFHPQDPVLWRLWAEVLAAQGDTHEAAAARARLPE